MPPSDSGALDQEQAAATPPSFDPSKPFTAAPQPNAAPPPFDPGKPFTAAPQTSAAPPPFDASKPFSAAAPQYTRDNPYPIPLSKTQEEHDTLIGGLSPGTWTKTPAGELMRTPQKVPEAEPVDATTGEKINYKAGQEPAVRDTGILGAIPAGLVGAGKGVAATAQTLAGGKPKVEEPDLLAAQPMEWRDFASPSTLAKKFLYQFAESTPTIAAAVYGGAAGTALGGGPETPLGWATGIAGTAAGAAVGSTLQSIGTNFGQALRETNGDSEAAWSLAMKRTGVEAAGSAAGFSAFSIAPFSSAVKNVIFQAFGIQPAVAVGQRAASNVVEGKPAMEGAAEVIPGAVIGTAAPLAAHAALNRFGAPRAADVAENVSPANQPRAGGTPPPGAPPIGTTIGMDLGRGVEVATVTGHSPDGDVILTDTDGQTHRMTPADVARLGVAIPAAEAASATPPEAAGAPPAAEAPPAEGAGRPAGAQGAPATPPVEITAPAAFAAPEARPRTQADLDRDDAERRVVEARAALVGEAPPATNPLQQATAADQAEIAKGAQGAAPAPPAAPIVAEPRQPTEVAQPGAPPPRDYMAEYEANQARLAAQAAPEGGAAAAPQEAPGWDQLGQHGPGMDLVGRPLAAGQSEGSLRLYRGEGGESMGSMTGGGWFTTDPTKAALYGAVRHVDVGANDLRGFARGASNDEFFAPAGVPEGGAPGIPAAEAPIAPASVPEAPAPRPAELPSEPTRMTGAKSEKEPAPVAAPVPANAPTVTDEKHTKTGKDIFAVRFPQKPDIDGLGAQAKKFGGYWSSFRGGGMQPGWMFKTREGADQFAAWATEKLAPAETVAAPAGGVDIGPGGKDLIPEYRKFLEDYAATGRVVHVSRIGGKLLVSVNGGPPHTPFTAVTDLGYHQRNRAPQAAPETQEPGAEAPSAEHPGLVVTEPRTGNTTHIQPPGTTNPAWTEIGKNADGQTLYEDTRGVRSTLSESGIRTTESVSLRPTRQGTEIGTDRVNNPEYEVAEPPVEQITPKPGEEGYVPSGMDPELYRMRTDVARAREETEEEPSADQKGAGNYAKGKVDFHGIPFVMENPVNSYREGISPAGERWQVKMPADYGYVSRTEGADGDHVDAYLGDDLLSPRAWVIDQQHADTGAFDEHKVMLGFADWPSAHRAYLDAFSDDRGQERLRNVTPMSLDELKGWLKEGDTTNPVGQQALPLGKEAPTLPAELPVKETGYGGDELHGAVPLGDAGAGPENVPGAAAARPPRTAPQAEEPRGPGDVEGAAGAAPEPRPSGAPAGGGNRPGDTDRVPPGEATPGEPGTAGGPPGPAGERPKAGRVPDADVKGTNHVIEPGAVAEERTPRVKARDNISAIELAKSLIAEGRPATKEEQSLLAKYVGWGGLSNAFPDPNTGLLRKPFEDVGGRLKELLTPDEYRTAARSTQYAHYTSEPVIRAMWDAVERMGFKGGAVFEPGMGIGHFLGMMPPDLAAASKYQGIELDHLTAQIAKLLYPESGVRQADFTRTPMPLDAFDMAIGNPPFGDIAIRSDPKYAARGFLLHDYFFAKSLDSVRPGGLLAFVTSAGTMNKMDGSARRYMAERAEFVGGVRLPSTAFAKNAGTEVTADILFFKKRPAPVDLGDQAPGWTETVGRQLPDARGAPIEGNVNRYFSEHPEMVLGEEGFFDKLYKGRYAVHETPGTVLADRLQEAFARLPENIMDPPMSVGQKAALDFSATEKKEGSYYVGQDGRLMQYSEGAGRPVAARGAGVQGGKTAAEVQTIRQLLPIRDALREVFRHDLADDAEAGATARATLNRVYDKFVKENGPINKAEYSYRRPNVIQQESARAEAREDAREIGMHWDEGEFDPTEMIARKAKTGEIARTRETARERAKAAGRDFDEGTFDPHDMPDIVIAKRPNIDPFQDDQESYRLRALEDYDAETGASEKRRVFYENTLAREQEPQLNSAQDGILWSMNKHGRLDIDAIAEKLGVDRNKIIEDMGDAVMRVPGTDETYVPRDAYLSGDVVSKLAEARTAAERDPRFQKNVSALEAGQPKPLSPSDIAMNIGMPWIPVETMHEFMASIGVGKTDISYSPTLGRWVVDTRPYQRGPRDAEWGTKNFRAHELLSDAMNRKSPVVRVTDKGPPQTSWVDQVATQAAQDKVQAIKDAFEQWAQADPERAHNLAELYNSKYNRIVLREWNGDYLTTPGVSSDWHWRSHQSRVVARIIQDGNTYMAHAVGAGKTSAMIGAGMEMRRLGLVNKPMYVVPNHMLGQFAKEFYEQYPTARIAVADDRNFHTDRRKQFVANVAQQDLDAIILTHSAFKKVPISQEFGEKMIREATDEIDEALRELGQDPHDLKKISRNVDRAQMYTVKQLQKRKERLEQKLLGAGSDQDVVNTFEEMGADFLFVDEAHQFRKLSFVTQTPMKGVTPEGSDMAWDLYTKIRYLDENRPGRSLVMASGTPVTNTMGELYSLSRYMQPQALKERGLSHFDSWSQAFGDTKTDIEQTAQGTYEPVTRFAHFVNMPELYKMVGSNMDVVTSEQLAKLVTRPELEGGGRNLHLAPRTPWLDRFQQELASRVKAIKDRHGPPQPGDDILLSVIGDGRKGGIDPRLVDPSQPNDQSSKLNQMIDNVHRIWAETKDHQFYDPNTGYQKEAFRGPATQMVFSNLGIGGGEGKFSGYQAMKREWVRRGIPADEIAFIKDFTTPVAKQRLLNDVNDGKVRILVGSTQKMGTGINAQRRLIAIHNLDPLWYPADDEQRNGRGLRQGNFNPTLQIHDYSTKGTYDSTMWAMMGRKGRFIEQFFRGDPNLRTMEDLGEASQYEQASAMSTSDDRVIKLTEMRQELQKIERRQQGHANEQYSLRYNAEAAEREAAYNEKRAAGAQDAVARAQDVSGDNFRMTVGNRIYPDRRAAATAIEKAIEATYPGMEGGSEVQVGEIGGFPLFMKADTNSRWVPRLQSYVTNKSDTPTFLMRLWDGEDAYLGAHTPTGLVQSTASVIRLLPERLAMYQQRQQDAQMRGESNRRAIGKPFTEGEKIKPLRQQIQELETAIRTPARPAETQTGAPGQVAELGPTGGMGAPEELRPTTGQYGLAEDRPVFTEPMTKTGPGANFRDLRDDFDQAVPWHAMDPQEAARQYVTQRGAETGNEHLVGYDARSGQIVHAGTSDQNNFVAFPDWGNAQTIVAHHNHPSGSSLSPMDLDSLPWGVGQVVAHGNGDVFSARLSPEYRAAMMDRGAPTLSAVATAARAAVDATLRPEINAGRVSAQDGNAVFQDLVNRALAHAGFIDYVSTRDPSAIIGNDLAQRAIQNATNGVQFMYRRNEFVRDFANGFHDRSSGTLRPEEAMAGLSRSAEDIAAGRSQGPGSDQGRGILREAGQGLAEESPDLSDEATRATVEEAVRAGGPRGIGGRFYDALGSGPKSPGAGDHFFNALNKDFTTPQTKAALDPRSNMKWQAELAKSRDAAAMLHGYHENLDSWQGKPAEAWNKQFAAMEILTLEGREVPLDGRAIIVENRDRPLAALSKVGDVIRLTSPEEIKMFTDYRQNMDKVWQDLVTETARQFGWEGEPTSAAIRTAAEAAGGSAGRRLERAAKIVGAIEYQHRTAYLPLMRSGDYFLRVKPTRPNESWSGEGYAPTTMFKLIDSLSPVERAIGGIREGTPRLANDAIADLRKTFPEDDYSIDHGYMFRTADALRDLDIPSIDKLMMLVGNDARGQMRAGLERAGMDAESARTSAHADYDKLVDTVLDQIYEQRVAGFKRTRQGIAGYDSDFAKSTGQYLSWLSNHISDLRHRPDIEAADQAIANHPDPRTQQFWKDWDRRQETYGDQLHGPLAKLRQGAFYWLLGMNAATTAKIMMHGPLRGVPVLTTGLGAQGRMQALGSYLGASRDMMRALGIGKGGIEVDFNAPGFAKTLSPAERAMLADGEAKGILHAQTADELAAVRSQGEEALSDRDRFFRRVLDIWGSNVSAADRMVRGSMMLAGYRTANRVGMDAINKVWDKDLNWRNAPQKTPEGFGQFLVDKTVGVWGDINRMPVLRSNFGGLIGQMKLYEIGYLSNMHQMLTRMGPEGKVTAALMLGGLGMMGGAVALPFAQDAESAISWLYQQISGIAPDLEGGLKNAMDALIPGLGEAAVHGGRPLGVDWSGIGFGDLVSRNMQSPLDLFGAAASTGLGSPYRAIERYKSGQGEMAAIRELLPNAVKHMLDGLYPEASLTSATGASKILSPEQLSDADRAKMGLGFNPEVRALRYEQIKHDTHIQTAYRSALTAAENRIANLHDRNEPADAALTAAQKIIVDGMHAGVFSTQEVKRFNDDLRRKAIQRANPTMGSRTQQRIEAAQTHP